jgi:branched-chain amino acid transport system permease protein
MNSLSGAVLGVVVISIIIQLLRWLEKGLEFGETILSIPLGLQEIALGVIMIVILMYRPSGLTRNRELVWKGWPFNKLSGGR